MKIANMEFHPTIKINYLRMKTFKYLVFVLVANLSFQNAYAQGPRKRIDAKA